MPSTKELLLLVGRLSSYYKLKHLYCNIFLDFLTFLYSYSQWKILSDFSSLDKIRPERVEPLFISKVLILLISKNIFDSEKSENNISRLFYK